MYKTILSLILLILFIPFANAENGDFQNVEQIGFFEYWGDANQTTVTGNYAHVAVGYSGYRILDISDLENPIEIGHCMLGGVGGLIYCMKVTDNYAYLLVYSDDIRSRSIVILDISEPTDIIEVGSTIVDSTQNSLNKIDISGNYLFATTQTDGMLVFDISNPANIVEVLHYAPLNEINNVLCHDDLVYISTYESGIVALDFTDPLNPVEVGSCASGNLWDMFLATDYIMGYNYVNPETRYIVAINITDPQEMTLDSRYPLLEGEEMVNVVDRRVFIKNNIGGIELDIFDFSDVDSPVLITTYVGDAEIDHVDQLNDHLFISQGKLVIADISNPSLPVEVFRSEPLGRISNIKVLGQYGFSFNKHEISTYDLTDPTNPLLIDVTEYSGGIEDFTISNGYSYLLQGDYITNSFIRILNIDDPSNVYSEGIMNLDHSYSNIESFDDDYIYLSSIENSVQILDVTNPLDPVLRGEVPTSGIPQGYDKVGNDLYCVDDDGFLTILDVFNPLDPQLTTSYLFSEPDSPFDGRHLGLDVEVENGFAYISYDKVENGYPTPCFDVLDISDYSNINLLNSIPLDYICYSIKISNEFLFMANYIDGIRIFDIHDPLNVEETGYYDTYGKCFDIELYNDMIVAADSYFMEVIDCEVTNGVEQNLNVPNPEEFTISSAYPNPFNPTLNIEISLPEPSEMNINIHNIMGQKVANITREYYSAGIHNFTFDGSKLSSGIYFVSASSPGEFTQTCKIILMK